MSSMLWLFRDWETEDIDCVMDGLYNWTPTANKNVETLATALDRELVTKFAKEFIELYNEIYF